MPEVNGLHERLAAGRDQLLSDIEQPPLSLVAGRAAALRRRRQTVVLAGALMALVAVGTVVVRPWSGGDGVPPEPADSPPPVGRIYTGGGITINGLESLDAVTDLPGNIVDVEFVDADRGYLVTGCQSDADDCRPAFARTDDGGRTWAGGPLPAEILNTPEHDIVAFSGARLVLDGVLTSDDGGRTWTKPPAGDSPIGGGPLITAAAPGDVLRLRYAGASCGPDDVQVWSPGLGYRGKLATQPPIRACWIAAVPTADGAWWVGGVSNDGTQAALAVTRDGGRTWSPRRLPGTGAARIGVVGRYAYAIVTDAGVDNLRAIFYSGDGGRSFTEVAKGGGWPPTIDGEPVPLLDGRLLLVSQTRWHVSADDGANFTQVRGDLPAVARIGRTPAGYVAYGLFGADWAAFSSDGANWRKLQVR